MLARTLSISSDTSDCGTNHMVTYDVKNKAILKKLAGKYFKLDDRDDLTLLDFNKHKDLIGKKIKVRSAVTCGLTDGCVCARCIGKSAVINSDIFDGYSALQSEEITKVVNQSILSTKHLLTTNSEKITFNSTFYKFMDMQAGEIYPRVDNNEDVDNIEDYAIYIAEEDKKKVDELDDDTGFNTMIYNGRFYIKNLKHPEEEDLVIQCEQDKEIFITDKALGLLKKGKGMLKFKDMGDDDKLFEITILNQELTAPLYGLMNLLNKKSDEEETIDSMSQKFLELLIESKISASVVAAEVITNRLVRDPKNIYERPDFSGREMPEYTITTISEALEKNKSPFIGTSYQDIKRQILSDDFFEKRDGTSYIDEFYKPSVSTRNLKRYSKIAKDRKRMGKYVI